MTPVRIEMDTQGSVTAGRWMGGGMLTTASVMLVVAALVFVTGLGEPSRWGGAAVVAGLGLLLVWHGRGFWALRRRANAHLQLSDDGLTIVDPAAFDHPVFVPIRRIERIERIEDRPARDRLGQNLRARRVSGWPHPRVPMIGDAFGLPPTTLLVFSEPITFGPGRRPVVARGNPYRGVGPRRPESSVLVRLDDPDAAHATIEHWLRDRAA